MAKTKFKFTETAIKKVLLPDIGKRVTYYDTQIPGLCLRVTHTGIKTYLVYKKINGKPERFSIGVSPSVLLSDARAEAQTILGEIARGINPADKRRDLKSEITLDELFQLVVTAKKSEGNRSVDKDIGQYNLHLSMWKTRKISSINKDDVKRLHTDIGTANGIYSANRLLAFINNLFNRAIDDFNWKGQNPCRGVKHFKEEARDRVIEKSEIQAFFTALDSEKNIDIRDYIILSLLTGARKANVLSMKWDEIYGDVWKIPRTKSKNNKEMRVPLVSQAIVLLKKRKHNKLSEYVFPSKVSASGHLVEPKKGWRRVLDAAGIEDLRIHDLRRSLGSYMINSNVDIYTVGKALGHQNQSTTARYAHLKDDPVKDGMQTAVDAMFRGDS